MKRLIAIFLFSFLAACNINPKPEEVEQKLKTTMLDYLYKNNLKGDSSKVKFRIQNVYYYDNKVEYTCEFRIKMLMVGKKDTVGFMKAVISKDFSDVKRTY